MPDDAILCACGCGREVPKRKYPGRQNRFINTHQHAGPNNGNFRGGKEERACPVCLKVFEEWPSQVGVTCGDAGCDRTWRSLKSAARVRHKEAVKCHHCGKEVRLFPGRAKPKNFCSRPCLSRSKDCENAGNWRGGKWRWVQGQALERDCYRCVICGFDQVVDVHHVVRRSDEGNDAFSDLITLCPNHHRMADLGLINVESYRDLEWTPDSPWTASHSRRKS